MSDFCPECKKRTGTDYCPDCGTETQDREYDIDWPVTVTGRYESYNEYVDFASYAPEEVLDYYQQNTNNGRATAKYFVFEVPVEITFGADGEVVAEVKRDE